MEPVTSTVLQALAAGAQTAATGIATDEIKRIYNGLKTLIQQQWSVKPPAEKLLSEYEKDPESWEQVLSEKLEQSGIHQDERIYQQAEQLLQKLNISVDQSRKASPGHIATTGAKISQDKLSAGRNAYKVDGNFSQTTTHNRQTRLAVLLGLLTLVLAGVVVYLVKTGKIQLPGLSPTSDSPPQTISPTLNAASPTASQKASLEDVEINIKESLPDKSPQFEGTITNAGKTEIKEFFIKVTMSKVSFDPPGLNGSKIIRYVGHIKNLQSGETRPVIWHFTLANVALDEVPKSYIGEKHNYTVYWGEGYKWTLKAVDKDTLLKDQKRLKD